MTYVVFFLFYGVLPWKIKHPRSRYESTMDKLQRVRTSKELATGDVLGSLSAECPLEFGEMLEYSRSLGFVQRVDYDRLMQSFHALAAQMECDYKAALDWTPCVRTLSHDVMAIPGLFSIPIESPGITNEELLALTLELIDYGNSYDDYWSQWSIHRYRDTELTLPYEQAQILDNIVPSIKVHHCK